MVWCTISIIHFLQKESSLLLNHTHKKPQPRPDPIILLEKTQAQSFGLNIAQIFQQNWWHKFPPYEKFKWEKKFIHISVDPHKIITHFCCKTLLIECHRVLDLLYLIYYTCPHIVIIGLNNISCRLMWKSFLLNIKLLILILQGFVLSKLM